MRHIIAPQAPCQWSTLGIETAFQHPSSILGASVKHKRNYYHSSLMLAQMEFDQLSLFCLNLFQAPIAISLLYASDCSGLLYEEECGPVKISCAEFCMSNKQSHPDVLAHWAHSHQFYRMTTIYSTFQSRCGIRKLGAGHFPFPNSIRKLPPTISCSHIMLYPVNSSTKSNCSYYQMVHVNSLIVQ